MKRYILAALIGLAAIAASSAADAQVSINLGIGGFPVYAEPPPIVYHERRVYRAPPPVVYGGHGSWGHDRGRPVARHDNHHHR